jgi:hypothetical protein
MSLTDRKEKAACNCCGNAIPFQVARLGETINCPHCLMETVLHLPDAPAPYPPYKYALEVERIGWEMSELGFRCITGEVVNYSQSNLDWVRIEFILFDEAEAAIGLASDCLLEFRAGLTWKFRAPVFEKNVARASRPMLSTEFGKISTPGDSGRGPTLRFPSALLRASAA